jgi:hypothetical protein
MKDFLDNIVDPFYCCGGTALKLSGNLKADGFCKPLPSSAPTPPPPLPPPQATNTAAAAGSNIHRMVCLNIKTPQTKKDLLVDFA